MSGNLWNAIKRNVDEGPMSLFWFWVGIVALVLGLIYSAEDVISTYRGFQTLEAVFHVRPVSYPWIMYAVAFAPWIGQVMFFGFWSLDTDRKWALGAAIFCFFIDLISDIQYRSVDNFLPAGGGVNFNGTTLVSAFITVALYTVGAELFVVTGWALATTLYQPARKHWATMRGQANRPGGSGEQPPAMPRQPGPKVDLTRVLNFPLDEE